MHISTFTSVHLYIYACKQFLLRSSDLQQRESLHSYNTACCAPLEPFHTSFSSSLANDMNDCSSCPSSCPHTYMCSRMEQLTQCTSYCESRVYYWNRLNCRIHWLCIEPATDHFTQYPVTSNIKMCIDYIVYNNRHFDRLAWCQIVHVMNYIHQKLKLVSNRWIVVLPRRKMLFSLWVILFHYYYAG